MGDAKLAQRKRRAAEIRAAYYAGRPYKSWPAVEAQAVPRSSAPAVEKRAEPCRALNRGWARTGLTLARVLASGEVPAAVREERLVACRACPHSTRTSKGHLCGCCGCPAWRLGGVSSYLEYKCRKAAWACPRPDPAFGAWTTSE